MEATQGKGIDMRKKGYQDLLTRVRDRYKIMSEADHENRIAAMKDLKFTNVPGEQWDPNMKQERGTRPCYEFNKLRQSCKRVINDMRANRPDAKVRATEGGDTDVASIDEGLIRNIASVSDLDSIIDYEAEYQVSAGMCAWRINTKYTNDDAFNQDIVVEAFRNPFTVYCDPHAKDFLKRDADDWCVTEKISKASYEARWPKADVVEFSAGEHQHDDDDEDWHTETMVRICEYWYKVPVKKTIWKVVDIDEEGNATDRIVDSESDEAAGIDQEMIKDQREIVTSKIKWCIASGQRILEEGDWAGRMFPFVMIYGEHAWIDGRMYWWGLPRFAKDAQRSYNVSRTAISETIAGASKEYFWATTKQAEGHTKQWQDAHKKNYPYKLYEPDPKAPGHPARVGGADVPIALMQEAQIASEEIKAVTGIFDASMGAQGNETSGRAIFARQSQGEIATFNFQDNMSKGVQRTYEIILDLIPEIYDTERELRVLGADGSESYKKVNQVVLNEEKKAVKVHDLAQGKYDVTITTGPSFSTQRQEASEVYTQLVQQMPELMGVAGDLIMKSMDLPYADDIAERMQFLLPPEIQKKINSEVEIPPEVQQMMAQAEQAMAAVEERAMMVQEAEQELEASVKENEQASHQTKLNQKEIEIRIERLRRVKAEFDTHVAKELAGLDTAAQSAEGAEGSEEVQQGILATAGAVRSLDDTLAAFMQAADQQFGELNAIANRKVMSSKPVKVDGKLHSEITYDDGTTHRVAIENSDD